MRSRRVLRLGESPAEPDGTGIAYVGDKISLIIMTD
jgi:hypothetical protein